MRLQNVCCAFPAPWWCHPMETFPFCMMLPHRRPFYCSKLCSGHWHFSWCVCRMFAVHFLHHDDVIQWKHFHFAWCFHTEGLFIVQNFVVATGILVDAFAECLLRISCTMMMSSNGNIFRITGHLCAEFTSHQWIPRTKASEVELWCFLWSAPWIYGWVNNHEAADLRHHSTHYDVIVMTFA